MSEAERDLKAIEDYLRRRRAGYPHFDATPHESFIKEISEGKYPVERHPFYPALGRIQIRRRFPRSGSETRKERPIRYAAKKDRVIFSFYRFLLARYYEKWLKFFGLSECVLAYRKAGSNIDHAIKFFKNIEDLSPCYVLCLDIKGFFDNISHERLVRSVEYLYAFATGKSLPSDVRYVVERVMKSPYVEEDSLSEYISRAKRKHKAQIMYPRQFRKFLDSGEIKIIKKTEQKSIPQGFPLSDLLSNIHLMVFDMAMARLVKTGWYGRYADDIAIVIPIRGHVEEVRDIDRFQKTVAYLLGQVDPELNISNDKSDLFVVYRQGCCNIRCINNSNRNKIQYLGFEWDGRTIFIRDATMARVYRKAKRIAADIARQCRKRGISKKKARDIVLRRMNENVGKVGNWKNRQQKYNEMSYKGWTFYSYAKLAERKIAKAKGGQGAKGIRRQVQRLHENLRRIAKEAVDAAYGG